MKTIGKLKMKINCEKKISSSVRKVDKNLVQRMYEYVYRKVDTIHRSGEKGLFQSRK